MKDEISNAEIGIIQTDFSGLISLLAKNLYPREDMFVRELIQNAHDAIQKRQYFDRDIQGRIDIYSDRDSGTIIFKDNGSGMTKDEIVKDLSTIGKSGTGDLKKKIIDRDRNRAQSLIGQFGIGVLSAFVVAERLEVDTLSFQGDQKALRWSVEGGPEYKLGHIDKDDIGTKVTLYLKPGYFGITNQEVLQKAIRLYADFIPFPIYLNDHGPINTIDAPWHRHHSSTSDRKKAYLEWVSNRFPDNPLEIIPIDIETPYSVKGVLYITDHVIPDASISGIVDIYQSRMFICKGDRGLLPNWAKFVRGVIDSPDFTPTAARDAIQEDRTYCDIRNSLGLIIINTLKTLAKEDPTRFRRLVEWHHYSIKGMALESDEFFDEINDLVPFEVNLQDNKHQKGIFQKMTLPEYLTLQKDVDAEGRRIIYYIREDGVAFQFYKLCTANRILAVNASSLFEEEFLKKYADLHHGSVSIRRVDIAEGTSIFEPLSDSERLKYAKLEFRLTALFRSAMPNQETIIKTENFAPSDIPIILTQTEDLDIADKLKQLAYHPSMSSSLGDEMVKAFGIQMQRVKPIIFHINATNSLIHRLNEEDFDDPIIKDAWLTLYNNAFMYSRQYLSSQSLEVLYLQILGGLNNVLALREDLRRLNSKLAELEQTATKTTKGNLLSRTSHVSLFVMMPFGDKYSLFERALRQVLEDDPYCFQIILARDRTVNPNLFENVKAHMRMVHGFIAEVSELSPNVMLELGMTEADAEYRPVIILRRGVCKEPIPVDLKGRLYLEYNLQEDGEGVTVDELADQLKNQLNTIEAIDQLRKKRNSRYLSKTYLSKKLGNRLSPDEAENLCKAFTTIEDLEKADKNIIAEKVSLENYLIAMIKEAFLEHR